MNMVDDAITFTKAVSERHPQTPIFLLGESMGGAVALLAGIQLAKSSECPTFRGCIFIAPALDQTLAPPASVIWIMRHLLLPIAPLWAVYPRDGWEGFYHSKEDADGSGWESPLTYSGLTRLQTAFNLLQLVEEAHSRMAEMECPFLVLHGTSDKAIPCSSSEALIARSSTAEEQKQLRTYEGGAHDLLWDSCHAPSAADDIVRWLDGQLSLSLG